MKRRCVVQMGVSLNGALTYPVCGKPESDPTHHWPPRQIPGTPPQPPSHFRHPFRAASAEAMSDATNDTTLTARALELANQRTPWTGPQLCEIDGMLRHYAAVLTDLERLAGPVCEHPPCKGARAVEHVIVFAGSMNPAELLLISEQTRSRPTDSGRCYFRYDLQTVCGGRWHNGRHARWNSHPANTDEPTPAAHPYTAEHPPSPSVEAWLRERAK